MDFRNLKYILSIYRNKSISKAAAEQGISQPAMSRFLIDMESRLEYPIFDKSNNNYTLTFIGSRFIDYAQEVLKLSEDWEEEARQLKNQKSGKLTVSIPLMRSSCIIKAIIPTFMKEYPDVFVELKEETHDINEDYFNKEFFDIAVFNTTPTQKQYIYELLGTENLLLVASKNNSFDKYSIKEPGKIPWIDIKHCENENFILYPSGQFSGKLAKDTFRNENMKPKVILRTRNTEVSVSLASSGYGIAFVPETYCEKLNLLYPINTYRFGNPEIKTTLYAVYKSGKFIPEYTRYFIDLIKDFFAEMMNLQLLS